MDPSPEHLLHVFGCLASALAYLHHQNVSHKEIKPSNVLLTPNGIWLADLVQRKISRMTWQAAAIV